MKTYKTIDKSEWGDGPWQNEPDKAQWIDEATELDCLIVRGPSGALCGYVGLPPTHPYHGKEYDFEAHDIWVHGGVTFSASCTPEAPEESGICHSGDVANEDVWWWGFDCAHFGDYTPKFDFGQSIVHYRTFDYVKDEVATLALQLARVTP